MARASLLSWRRWNVEALGLPGGDRPAIYQHLASRLDAGVPDLSRPGESLPDEVDDDADQIRFAPGAMDGAFGLEASGEQAQETAGRVFEALRRATERAETARLADLYALTSTSRALAYADPLVERVIRDRTLKRARLREVALLLAQAAPDRETVKIAIALLGAVGQPEDVEHLQLLGRHDEFTLFAAVALCNLLPEPWEALWELGRTVEGWGRVHVVERLAEAPDPEIRRWLLLEGYSNWVMLEYTAYRCATAGGLLEALRDPQPEPRLLEAAGEILGALITGEEGPAEGIDDYGEGAEAVERWLGHLEARELTLKMVRALERVEEFLADDEGPWEERAARGWTEERRLRQRAASVSLLDGPAARRAVEEGLASSEGWVVDSAAQLAPRVGLDPWSVEFARLAAGEDCWYQAMQTDDPARVDRVLAVAQERIPLEKVGTGPSKSLGFGPEFQAHRALDWVLQELRRFPGRGWPLLRAGLRSPVTRNRHMALTALARWERQEWPPEAELLLRQALAEEPDEKARERLRRVLAGESVDDGGSG